MSVNNGSSVYNAVDFSEYATKQELDDATAAWSAGYTPKGPASVSTINGLTGQQNGDVYTLTDGGTVNPGALTVSAGDQIAWNATNSVWYIPNQYALKENFVITEGFDRYSNGVSTGLDEYYIDASGVIHTDVNYFVTEAVELKPGEKISFTDVVNNIAFPLFSADTNVITTSTIFTALGTGKTSTPSYNNDTNNTIYVVLCQRKGSSIPAHYTITKFSIDCPSYSQFKELEQISKGIKQVNALEYYDINSYGVIAIDGTFNNSSNYENVRFRRESWMKKLLLVTSNNSLNRLNVAFFTFQEFDKDNCQNYFISGTGKKFYGTDVKSVVDIPDNCNYIFISSLKSLGVIKELKIFGSYDDLSILSFNNDIIDKIYASNMTRGATPVLSLIHFSDIHGNKRNLKNIIKIKNYYSDIVADIIDTGDDVTDQFSDEDIFSGVPGSEFILRCIGNHDNAVKSGGVYDWNAKTASEVYAKFFDPYIANWGTTYTPDLCYYYKDYTSQGIRLIVLDCMHNDATQEAWLDTILQDAKSNSLAVICANHYPRKVDAFETSFNDASATTNNMPTSWCNSVEAFINGGGEFICWICGHTHRDSAGTIENYNNQVMVVIDTAATGLSTSSTTYRKNFTRSQDLMNVIAIDRNNTTVKFIRIGARERDTMEVITSMVVNYSTRSLVR